MQLIFEIWIKVSSFIFKTMSLELDKLSISWQTKCLLFWKIINQSDKWDISSWWDNKLTLRVWIGILHICFLILYAFSCTNINLACNARFFIFQSLLFNFLLPKLLYSLFFSPLLIYTFCPSFPLLCNIHSNPRLCRISVKW